MKEKLITAPLTEESFQTLLGAGFFKPILIHPEIEVYTSSDKDMCVHIPGRGAVQIVAKKS